MIRTGRMPAKGYWNESLNSASSTTASFISRFSNDYPHNGQDTDDNDEDDSVFSDNDSLNTISSIVYMKDKSNEKQRHETVYSVDEEEWAPTGYTKHSALAVSELSFKQQVNLRWKHTKKWSNMIRCGMIIFCLGWFVFNSVTILLDYWRHDSMIFLQYKRPDKTVPPGITICTHCVLCK